jgi:predicted PurR-regulated permease PerM
LPIQQAMDQPPHPPWHRLHLWDIQLVRDAVTIALVASTLWLAWMLRAVTVPLLIGLFLADVYEPVVCGALRWRSWVTRGRFVLASAALALVLVAGALAVTLPPLLGQTGELLRDLPRYADEAVRLSEAPWVPAVARDQIAAARMALNPPAPRGGGDLALVPGSDDEPAVVIRRGDPRAGERGAESISVLAHSGRTVLNAVLGSLAHLANAAIFVFLVPFSAVLFSLNFPRVRVRLRSIAPASARERVAAVARRMEQAVGGFFRGRLLVCLALAGVYAIGLTICGVPYGLLLGLATGLLCLIPWLHFMGLPVAWCLLAAHAGDSGGWYSAGGEDGMHILWLRVLLLPLAVWAFAQLLDDYLLSPLIQGQKTDLHPATVLVSIIGGAALAGFWGLIAAVPVVSCVKIAAQDVIVPALRGRFRAPRTELAGP